MFGPRFAAGPSEDFGIPVMSPPPAQVALPPPPREPDPPIERIVIDAPAPMPTVAAPLVAASTEGAPVLKFSGPSRSTPAPQQGGTGPGSGGGRGPLAPPGMGARPLAAPGSGPRPAPGPTAGPAELKTPTERAFFEQLNKLRMAQGLSAYNIAAGLCPPAQDAAADAAAGKPIPSVIGGKAACGVVTVAAVQPAQILVGTLVADMQASAKIKSPDLKEIGLAVAERNGKYAAVVIFQ